MQFQFGILNSVRIGTFKSKGIIHCIRNIYVQANFRLNLAFKMTPPWQFLEFQDLVCRMTSRKFFIMSTEFDKNISD